MEKERIAKELEEKRLQDEARLAEEAKKKKEEEEKEEMMKEIEEEAKLREQQRLEEEEKKKNLNLMDENEELLNERFNSEKGIKIKNPKFKRNESYFGLVKFKDFHNLTKTSKYSDKKNMKISSEINPNFSKYLKEVKKMI